MRQLNTLLEIIDQYHANPEQLRKEIGRLEKSGAPEIDRLSILKVAHTLLSDEPSLTPSSDLSQWLAQLADTFINNTNIDDHEKWAMYCWVAYLRNVLPEEIKLKDIIQLGQAYACEPYQFAAFLYYLVGGGVKKDELLGSGLLHRYFYLVFFDIEALQLTYTLLEGNTKLLRLFLDELKKISYQYEDEDQEGRDLGPYNIRGQLTTDPLKKLTRAETEKLPVSHALATHGDLLFRLFQMNFIHALDLEVESHVALFVEVIKSRSDAFYAAVAEYGLRESMYSDDVKHMLRLIAKHTSSRQINKIVKHFPFFLHLITSDANVAPGSVIAGAKKICETRQSYEKILQIPLLVTVAAHVNAVLDEVELASRVAEIIFDIVINSDTDEITGNTMPLLKSVSGLLEAHFGAFLDTCLMEEIKNFLIHRDGYEAIEEAWEANEPKIGLIVYLCPGLIRKQRYPETVTALRSRVLLAYVNHNDLLEDVVSIAAPLSRMSLDEWEEINTLQETLRLQHHEGLVQAVLNHVASYDSKAQQNFFFDSPFSTYDSFMHYVMKGGRQTLLAPILQLITFSNKQCIKIAKLAIDAGVYAVPMQLYARAPSSVFVDSVINHALEKMSSIAMPQWSTACWKMLVDFCTLTGAQTASSKSVSRVFLACASLNYHGHVVTLLAIRGDNQLCVQDVRTALGTDQAKLLQLAVRSQSCEVVRQYWTYYKQAFSVNELVEILNQLPRSNRSSQFGTQMSGLLTRMRAENQERQSIKPERKRGRSLAIPLDASDSDCSDQYRKPPRPG